MTQHNSLNGKLSNPQFKISKTAVKNDTGLNLRLLSNTVGEFKGETNSSLILLLTGRQVWKICKASLNKLFIKNAPIYYSGRIRRISW